MVRLDGQNSIPPCRTGAQRGSGTGTGDSHPAAGTRLLFRHLPAGRLPGHRSLVLEEEQEEPLPLLACPVVAALRRTGRVRRHTGGRRTLVCGPAGPLQFVRTHRKQPVRPHLPVGKQLAGLPGRAGRQLRFLRHHCLAEKLAHLRHRRRHAGGTHRTGLARRTHVLQHHLPRRYRAGLPVEVCLPEAGHRHRQVRQLQSLRTQLQSLMHRHQEPPDRLQPLRGLHGLSGQVQAPGAALCPSRQSQGRTGRTAG